jgi:PPOX class probable F420-dependent enzyme
MDEAFERLLAGRRIAVLATERRDGSAQLTPMWYRWDGDAFTFATAPGNAKVRNVRERPRASALVDARGAGLAFVAATGPVELVEGAAAARLNLQVFERYVSPEGMAHPAVGGLLIEHDTVAIRLVPERWSVLDLASMLDPAWATPGYVLPLDP